MQPIIASWYTDCWQVFARADKTLTLFAQKTMEQIPIMDISGLPEKDLAAFSAISYFTAYPSSKGLSLKFYARGNGGMPTEDQELPDVLKPFAHLLGKEDVPGANLQGRCATAAKGLMDAGKQQVAQQLLKCAVELFPNDFELNSLKMRCHEDLND